MIKTSVLGVLLLWAGCAGLEGQATTTASRRFDFQAGVGFSSVQSDYGGHYKGYALYTTLDLSPHFGGEFDFHQAKNPVDAQYERTYEIGVRYHRTYGRFMPYAKAMYGRGVYNFVQDEYDTEGNVTSSITTANLAYNEYVFGGGTDFRILPYLNARVDYEYENWRSFPPHGLTPQVLTFGVAYHFPGGLAKGNRFK